MSSKQTQNKYAANSAQDKFGSRKRILIIAVVLLFAVILALAGTFAWQSFKANAVNNAKGAPGPAGGRLHDDYEVMGDNFGQTQWAAGKSANKDIYVENYESVANGGRDIFVRVKLYEYMEIGAGANLSPLLENGNPDPAYTGRTAISLVPGADRDDYSTWAVRLPGADATSDMFKSRWGWTQGGQKTFMPTFNMDNHSEETDIKGDAVDPNGLDASELQNTTELGESHAYSVDGGLQDYFAKTATTWDAKEKYWDSTLVGTGTSLAPSGEHVLRDNTTLHTSKLTEKGQVITMAAWKETPYDGKPGNFWIVDTDGWAYWANPLAPESATGLLVDSITLQGEPDDEWYYGIYVDAEMATAADWMSTADGMGFYADPEQSPSADAKDLLNIITGHLAKVTSMSLSQNTAAVVINSSLTLTANVTTKNTSDQAYQEVLWSISPAAGSRFTNGTFNPTAADVDNWFTITATSAKDPSKYATCKVYVPKTDQGVTTGEDGNNYVYFIGADDNTYQRVLKDGTLGQVVCPVEVGHPGANTDRSNVVTIDSQHYLDEGNNKYYGVGADGKLGTADDAAYFNDNGTMKPLENEVSLTLSPNAATVNKGKSLELGATATLYGAAQDTSGITWNLIGTYATGTALSTTTGGNVTLSCASTETKSTITVRATYPGANATSKDLNVVVKSG